LDRVSATGGAHAAACCQDFETFGADGVAAGKDSGRLVGLVECSEAGRADHTLN
jgi:hypothetical protein